MNSIKISIIIPVYNVAPYIQVCLQSVKCQTYKNIEVIFVDDCGTDESVSFIADFIFRNNLAPWQIVHHSVNKGLSAARNTGLRTATGDYVYFLDSDDYITPDCLEVLVAQLSKKAYDMVIGDYDNSIDIGESMLCHKDGEIEGNDEILRTYAQGQWYVMAWNKLCRREFLMENNLFFEEGLLHEDVIWSFKVACKAASMYVVKQPTYIYSIREASIMTGMSIDKDVSIYVKAFDKIADFIKKEHRELGQSEYSIFQGKRAGILYSLLQKGESALYEKYYPMFYKQCYVSPWKAYQQHVISKGYLIRDMHYLLPVTLGKWYMRLFYAMCYKWRGKKIEGAVWG